MDMETRLSPKTQDPRPPSLVSDLDLDLDLDLDHQPPTAHC